MPYDATVTDNGKFAEQPTKRQVRTPRWVGWFFQRPEMHRIHHQHRRHRNNYGDITWWDMLFATYENPEQFTETCGFDPEKEERLGAMLLYADVHREPDRR